jgi:hypothetical protein
MLSCQQETQPSPTLMALLSELYEKLQNMPVNTKAQVLSLLQKYQQELQQFGVSRCGLFGSFVRDSEINDRSDVDILVAFKPDQKTFDNFMHLSFFLEDIFGRAVDLITVESLSPYIGPRILDEVEYVSLGS